MASEPMDIYRVMSEALRLKIRGDFQAADRILSEALEALPETESDSRAGLFAFSADLATERGAFSEARRHYGRALELSTANPYRRYSIELGLGALSEKINDKVEAAQWYRSAIKTAVDDDETSAASAVARLLGLRGKDLPLEERDLCERAVDHSWRVLGLEGEPDRKDLAATASKLIEAASRRA